MKRHGIVIAMAAIMFLMSGAGWAENDSCDNADFAMLGQIKEDGVSDASIDQWYKVKLYPSRSYSAFAWAPYADASEATVNLDLDWYLDDCSTPATGVYEGSIEGAPVVTGHIGDLDSIIPSDTQCSSSSGCTYRVRLRASSMSAGTAFSTNVAFYETTLNSPYYMSATSAGYDSAPQIRNNNGDSAIIVVYSAYDASGSTICRTTKTIAANGMATFGTSDECNVDYGYGSAQIAHSGPPGSVTANITTFSASSGLSFDAPFFQKMTWTGAQ